MPEKRFEAPDITGARQQLQEWIETMPALTYSERGVRDLPLQMSNPMPLGKTTARNEVVLIIDYELK